MLVSATLYAPFGPGALHGLTNLASKFVLSRLLLSINFGSESIAPVVSLHVATVEASHPASHLPQLFHAYEYDTGPLVSVSLRARPLANILRLGKLNLA